MARNWTDEQLEAIGMTNRTVLLSAAAGSGKTATLTERLIRMITAEEDPLDVSRMVVATFTRAAAAELRERIASAVEDSMRGAVAEEEALLKEQNEKGESAEWKESLKRVRKKRENLLRASLLLPSATIRTIDSFCNDLVKSHAESLGLLPHYRILDEAEVTLLMAEIMDKLIEDAYSGVFRAKGLDIAYLVECMTDTRKTKSLSSVLTKMHQKLDGFPDGLNIFRDSLKRLEQAKTLPYFETPWGEVVKSSVTSLLNDHAEGLKRVRSAARAEDDKLYEKAVDHGMEELIEYAERAAVLAEKSYTDAKAVLKECPSPNLTSGDDKLSPNGLLAKNYAKYFIDKVETLLERFFAWEEKDIPYAAEENARLTETLLLLFEEFERRFTAEKRRMAVCTYADIEHLAYRLLYNEKGERTPLAKELAASYDAICIDEYQDVNDLQHAIFEAISTPRDRFMVGDIKQSIYAFRGANPRIFKELRQNLPSDKKCEGTVLYLTRNFRSHENLIDFNNAVFDFLFERVADSIGYDGKNDALHVGVDPPAHPLPKPELLYTYKGKNNPDPTEEWDIIAEKILALRENGAKADGSPIAFSDITVLYRSGEEKPQIIADALRAHGIPVLVKDTRNFFETPEILLALCLLQVVNNPRRNIYLAGLLRSPLYCFTMDELIALRGDSDSTLYDELCAFTEKHPDFAKGKRFLSDLAHFRAISEGESADRLCRRLFEETALYSVTDGEGKKRLRVLCEYARKYESGSFHGLYRFLSHLDEILKSGESIGTGAMLGDSDGVKIMTMHGSKGLEFPVCFIANAKPAGNNFKDNSVFHPSLGVAFPIRDRYGLAVLKNPFFTAIETKNDRDDLEEEMRVLYVALTRASEQMYITAHSSSKPETVLSTAQRLALCPSRALIADGDYFEWALAAILDKPHLADFFLNDNTLVSAHVRGVPPSLPEEEEQEAAAKPADEEPRARRAHDEEEVKRYYDLYKARFDFAYPHAAALKLPSKVAVSKLFPGFLDEADEPLSAEQTETKRTAGKKEPKTKKKTIPFFLSHVEEDAAAKAGTATHVFLQFCDFAALRGETDETLTAAIHAELDRLFDAGFMHKEDTARVRVEEILSFAKSSLQKELLDAKKIYRELRFNAWLPASLFTEKAPDRYEGHSIFTQGVIDLIIETKDGELILVDYKTDRLTREQLADPQKAREELLRRYTVQLTYYAHAIERVFGKAPKEIKIYSLHAGECYVL